MSTALHISTEGPLEPEAITENTATRTQSPEINHSLELGKDHEGDDDRDASSVASAQESTQSHNFRITTELGNDLPREESYVGAEQSADDWYKSEAQQEQWPQSDDTEDKSLPEIEPWKTSFEPLRCTLCWESHQASPFDQYIPLVCGEIYCIPCINDAFEFALKCEANFPLLCGCRRRIHVTQDVADVLSQDLLGRHNAVVPEWTSLHRTYCANCHQFLDSQKFKGFNRFSRCTSCNKLTCRQCKADKDIHDPECPPDHDSQNLLNLSATMGWKQCRRCGYTIERSGGCDHIV